jgi:hypothetical protein
MCALNINRPDQCVVAVYGDVVQADLAVRDLESVGLGGDHVSLIRRQFDPDPTTAAEMRLGDDSMKDAAVGGAIGSVAGAAGAATLISAGMGMVLMTGPLAVLTGAIVGALLGAMRGWGVHDKSLEKYEKLVAEGKTLVVVSGSTTEVSRAEQLLRLTDAESVDMHMRTGDDSHEVDDRLTR